MTTKNNRIFTRTRAIRTTAIITMAAGLTGCVSQGEYDKLWETNRSLTDQLQQTQASLEACNAQNAALSGSAGGASGVIANLTDENTRLRDQLNQAMQSMRDLEGRLGGLELGRLDPTTDRALANLARQYPDLIVYDADRGMLRFSSDLTFASGSDQVQPAGADALGRLATVLSSNEAAGYDIVIVGHTDSQRISSATAQRHPTNMHLSAHRAISVRRVLSDRGVAPERLQAAGWGEHRPAVPNNPSAGTAENRRVEIYLVPSTWRGPSGSAGASTQAPAQPAAPQIDPTK
ncbi:OmpA/MotB family protein [Nodularia spumigena]|uniref:OmpA/MotB family protein n=1 Tax=Nodularia spumigena TaxID=70799 RepID=UPI002B21F593|nr:OmpA family protein [Nodularia spumigena]MEA5614507.1 OmpA family protein [Nodularia spumigena UHCC 0040]